MWRGGGWPGTRPLSIGAAPGISPRRQAGHAAGVARVPGIVSPQMATSATARPAAAPRGTGRIRAGAAGAAAFLADPRRVLCLACALLALIPCVDVLGDPDVWWHLRAGRWILDHHAIPRAEL